MTYPLVLLVLTPFDGDPVSLWLPAPLAVACLWSEEMGREWYSARIVADDVDMGAWDRSV